MKLLTFLGVAQYAPTIYVWQEQEHSSRFAPAASCRFLHPDFLTVFLTEEAHQQVFPDFCRALPEGLKPDPIPIPFGKDDRELWQIFNQVSGAVRPGEEVAFDITHGFRSLPLLGLLAAAFLRAGLGVSLRAVLYGAYVPGQERTPMFDLTPMLSLLEWAAAADRFNRTGDARYLASLLKNARNSLAKATQGDPAQTEQIGRLGNLAGALEDISQSLRLIRPYQAMTAIAGLSERMEKAQPALQSAAIVRPFSMLLESVERTYRPLSLSDPLTTTPLPVVLDRQRAMINWYVEREQWVQAVALAREWVVSWAMLQLGLMPITGRVARQRAEDVLNAEANDFADAKKTGTPFTPIFLKRLPQVETVLSLWLNLTGIRNDILHAGMREDPGKPDVLIKQARDCIDRLNALPV